jgi:hypothetical protein
VGQVWYCVDTGLMPMGGVAGDEDQTMILNFEHKTGFAREVTEAEVEAIFEASREYVIAYGIRQSLADAMASAKTEDEADQMFSKRFRKLTEGSMDIREVSRSSDPVRTETRRLANVDLDAWVKDGTIPKLDKQSRKAWVAELMKDEARVATAQANVEREIERAKAPKVIPAALRALIGRREPDAPDGEGLPQAPKSGRAAKSK